MTGSFSLFPGGTQLAVGDRRARPEARRPSRALTILFDGPDHSTAGELSKQPRSIPLASSSLDIIGKHSRGRQARVL